MKKYLAILVIIIILVFLGQVITNIFIKERSTEYNLGEYKIKENLNVSAGQEIYDFLVTDKDKNTYIFSIKDKFNKQKEIIEEIKSFKEGKLKCIYPIYKKDKTGDVVCIEGGKQVSYAYLKQSGNKEISKIIKKLQKSGYHNKKWEEVSQRTVTLKGKSKKIEVYEDNILEGYTFLIWRYRGLYILNNEKSVVKDYLEYDQYDNLYSALIGEYYITADVNPDNEKLQELVYFDTKKLEQGKIKFKDETSIKYYFNGVIEDKLYMTDVGLNKQYVIDPKKKKIEVLLPYKDKFMTQEGKTFKEIEPKELLEDEVYFTNNVSDKKLNKLYKDIVECREVRDYYYFRTSTGEVYRVNKNNLEARELLFKFKNISEMLVKDDDILVVVDEMVYFYNDQVGLLPIAKNSELKYNHKNICDFWKA